MKTFKEFLSEEQQTIKELIETKCGPYLEMSGRKGALIRGMNPEIFASARTIRDDGVDVQYVERSVRKDRSPKDMIKGDHQLLDTWFDKKFGIKARTGALFVFGGSQSGLRRAESYGKPYLIFPIGNFKFVWSPKVTDLYVNIGGKNFSSKEEGENDLDAELSSYGYKDTDFEQAAQARNEIMLDCDKYLAFSYHHRSRIEQLLGIK